MPKPLAEGNSWIISGWNQGMPVGYTVYPPWVLTSSQAWSFASCRGLVNHPRWWTKKPGWDICIIKINILSFVHMDLGNQVIFVSKVESSFGSLQIFGDLLAMIGRWHNPTSSKNHRCIHIENSLEIAGSQWTSWGWVSCCTVDFHWGKRPI